MFEFEWPVDSHGYEWVGKTTSGLFLPAERAWQLHPCGGPNRFYRPLEDHPGLFRRFASLPADKDTILEFTNSFGLLDDHVGVWGFREFVRRIVTLKQIIITLGNLGRTAAAIDFNNILHPRFSIAMDIDQSPPALTIKPATLYGAMMLQLSQEISGIAKFKKCKQCPEWFALGKNRATARREFCSDRCRVAWHRSQHRGG